MRNKTGLIIAFLALAAGSASAADHLIVSAGLGYLKPADSGYREVYGSQAFYPEFQAAVRLAGPVYLAGGFGVLSKKGETVDLHLPAKSTQLFFTAGLACIATVSGGLKFRIEAGAADVSYKEEALDESVSGSKLGFEGSIGLLLMGKVAFAGLNLGYLYATDTVEDVKIKLGGARASVCLGFRI
jgi:hypothetical protein